MVPSYTSIEVRSQKQNRELCREEKWSTYCVIYNKKEGGELGGEKKALQNSIIVPTLAYASEASTWSKVKGLRSKR